VEEILQLVIGVDWTEYGYFENPQQALYSLYLQEPVAVLAFLRSPHLNAGMKQYECGRTQPLLRVGHDPQKTSGQSLKGLRHIINNNYDIQNTIINNYDIHKHNS
jgi:hypothetical protein